MKVRTIIISGDEEERAELFVHSLTDDIKNLERLISKEKGEMPLIGFKGDEKIILSEKDVYCFISESGRIWALTDKYGRLAIKQRIYQLEEILSSDFIKINQSAIANIVYVELFSASVGGSLTVRFKNGYTDYVSRRNIGKIKERFGL